ncbi:hypothetical protein MKZ38_000496 [Zalerion maritima]|uniref:Mitochondrial outer membrane protein OM14 C-terminal domain-containing protein n=1 Tax=Zalerion maritima TaxID=339359 RepID=A0AAD5WSJ2_9PEZI|nr:hypothetical protein MKZ38_000496 [Zalerion maritima]
MLSSSLAAANPVPEVETTTEASTSSLVDVDHPSVRTVPSDFMEQDIKTDTQAERIDREEAARAEKDLAKKPKSSESIFSRFIDAHSGDKPTQAITASNLLAVVGISSFLGYKAWGLYEKGALSWKHVGIGAGVMGLVAAAETLLGGWVRWKISWASHDVMRGAVVGSEGQAAQERAQSLQRIFALPAVYNMGRVLEQNAAAN